MKRVKSDDNRSQEWRLRSIKSFIQDLLVFMFIWFDFEDLLVFTWYDIQILPKNGDIKVEFKK